MKLKNKRVAILAEEMYQDLELWYPYYRLKEEGADVKVIGSGSAKSYKGKNGYPVTADHSVEEVSHYNFDAVVIPGGFAPDYMRRRPRMVKFVRDMYEQGKIVAAICHAGWILVSAGVLNGKSATSYHSIKDDIVNAGAKWIDAEVVADGNLITSRQPDDLPAFCRKIIEVMTEV